jgi:hypothetical protein
MGRQYNKVENRKRRNRYIKRKKITARAKKPAPPAVEPKPA